jgi:hypothetical protein
MDKEKNRVFGPADILLPKSADMEKWSVIACDQHTSEPEYWEGVDEFVGQEPSTLRLMLPEHLYHCSNLAEMIEKTRSAMDTYLDTGVFQTIPDSYIYVERTLFSGKVRRGLIGQIDLECYDHSDKSGALIRSTEGIVKEKMPPRIRLREGARAELTHVLVLVDDPERMLIEPLIGLKREEDKLYDFTLMEQGGHIRGYRVNKEGRESIEKAIDAFLDPDHFRLRYGFDNEPVLLFATGDGNHSLATAKACWEKMKPNLTDEERQNHPARFALVEIVNIRDEALEFEPINRVMFNCDPKHLLDELLKFYPGSKIGLGEGHNISFSCCGTADVLTIPADTAPLAIGALGNFFDWYLERYPGKLDFVHGDDVVIRLSRKKNTIGFVLPAIDKSMFFASIIRGGAMPRKTFSMGSARDKRYYLELRRLEKTK